MKLYFENSYGERRPIADVTSREDVYRAIHNFIDECNKYKTEDTKFKSYYTRYWDNGDGFIKYDVGSWSEFFLLKLSDQERVNFFN